MQAQKKSKFLRLVDYITDNQGKDVRVGMTRLTNFESGSLAAAVAEAIATQGLNTRATGDKTYHLLVSFREGDRPSGQVLNAIEDRLVEALGFAQHQRVSAVHEDTEHLHIHIAINKIHPKRLTMHDPFRAYAKIGEICEQLEKEYGLAPDNHTRSKRVSEDRADDITAHRGVEAFLHWARRECAEMIRSVDSWDAVHRALRTKDVWLSEKGNGLVLTNGHVGIKASSLGREFSLGRLEARLGPFERPAEGSVEAGSRTTMARTPLNVTRQRPVGFGGVDTNALYARYQKTMDQRKDVKSRATSKVRTWRDGAIRMERARNQTRREAIRSLSISAGERRALYSAESLRMREAVALVRERATSDLRIVMTRTAHVGWIDWLRLEAARGDETALTALRSRSGGERTEKVNTLGSEVERRPVNFAVVRSVTRRGSLVMGQGIRDEGKRLVVAKDASLRAVNEAMLVAARRFGPRLIVSGTPEFKAMAIRAAVDARLPIAFIDPLLEQRRRDLVARETAGVNDEHAGRNREFGVGPGRASGGAGRGAAGVKSGSTGTRARDDASTAREPDVERIGRDPPPASRNRLRDLSVLDVVRLRGRAAVLLPRDVPRELEKQRPTDADSLRRPVPEILKPQETIASAAADKYIAEREGKRLRGLSIPEHVRYDTRSAQSLDLSFSGFRTVDGESLALLSDGTRIMVLPITGKHASDLKGLKLGSAVHVNDGMIRSGSRSEGTQKRPRR